MPDNISDDVFIVKCQKLGKAQKYGVAFNYNTQLIERIKSLPFDDRKFDGGTKLWTIKTFSLYNLILSYRGSNKIRFEFIGENAKTIFKNSVDKILIEEQEKKLKIEELERNKKEWLEFKADLDVNYEKYSEEIYKLLIDDIELYPHQIVSAHYINRIKNILLSLDMGLGKTLCSICYVEMNNFKKVIVITPNSLKFNYYDEINKFLKIKQKAHVVGWKDNIYTIHESKYVILNYDFFNPSDKNKMDAKFKKLGIEKIDALICDESARLKNTKSNTYKNFNKIFVDEFFENNKVSKVFLSGTPCPNEAKELYTTMHQISVLDFPTKTFFENYYCGIKYNPQTGMIFEDVDESKLEELYFKISPYTYRKRKSEVLKDLPDKIYQKLMFDLSDKELKIYNEMEEGAINEIIDKDISNPLTIMMNLRMYLSKLKVPYIIDFVNDIIDTGEKIVIVDFFKESLYELHNKFENISGLHTGDIKDLAERSKIVSRFQDMNDPMKLFLGSMATCKEGLTLTASSKLLSITESFTPGDNDQVYDRLHRISQKNVVNIYNLTFRNTIDEYVFDSVESKRKNINKVMDNETYISNVGESVMSDVIKKIKEKYKK